MPLQKNQVLTLTIERLSNDGSGVAHSPDGEAVFIPGTAPGDVAAIRIVKDCGRYAFGILDAIQTPSPDRIPVDCTVAGPCGGCSLRHLDYSAELRAKGERQALHRFLRRAHPPHCTLPRLQAAAGCAERDRQYPLRFLCRPRHPALR